MAGATVAAIIAVMLARAWAARRFAATGAPWAIWFRFGLSVFAGFLAAVIGLTRLDQSPMYAALVIFGFVFAYLGFRFAMSSSRSVAAAENPAAKADALVEPLADYMLGLVGLTLLFGVAIGVLALVGAFR